MFNISEPYLNYFLRYLVMREGHMQFLQTEITMFLYKSVKMRKYVLL